MPTSIILLANLAATLYMTGVIWFVQIVHYPLFGRVGANGFAAYEAEHTMLTGWVVGPPMALEALTAVFLVMKPPKGAAIPVWIGLALVSVLWLSTALLQVPKHAILGGGYNEAAHHFLVASNWIRTVAWSLRALLMLWIVAGAMK